MKLNEIINVMKYLGDETSLSDKELYRYDMNKDGVVDNKDIEVAKQKISELKHSITKNYSNQEKWALKEIQRLENFISDNDENYTKIY